MKRLRKFLNLPFADKGLLLKSACLLGAIRLGLWLLPFRILRQLLGRISRPTCEESPKIDQTAIRRVTWSVAVMSRYIPKATCLTQALTTQVLLGWLGQPAHLRIGVAKNESGRLEAHAWLESEGAIIIGGLESPRRFTPLPPLDANIR